MKVHHCGFDFSVTMLDSGCDSKQSLGVLTDQLFIQPLDVVIGPPCADGTYM